MRVWLVKFNGVEVFSSPSLHNCAGFVNQNKGWAKVSISSMQEVRA